jgi:hypothetical protein
MGKGKQRMGGVGGGSGVSKITHLETIFKCRSYFVECFAGDLHPLH